MTETRRKMELAIQKNREERMSNLRIMLRKGKITQAEFDQKMAESTPPPRSRS